jgi:hypothetical protein
MMINAFRLSIVAAVALTLTACGGAKLGGGKQGAAEALFQASGPAASTKGAAARMLQSGAVTGEVKVDGQKSGSATLSFDVSDSDSTNGYFAYNVKYDNFSDDGKNYYSGQMALKLKFDFNITQTSAAGSMVLTMKGKINISGEISDFLDADITETVDFSALSSQSGSVTVKLDGRIATSTETHTYANETISFTADGDLPAEGETP